MNNLSKTGIDSILDHFLHEKLYKLVYFHNKRSANVHVMQIFKLFRLVFYKTQERKCCEYTMFNLYGGYMHTSSRSHFTCEMHSCVSRIGFSDLGKNSSTNAFCPFTHIPCVDLSTCLVICFEKLYD